MEVNAQCRAIGTELAMHLAHSVLLPLQGAARPPPLALGMGEGPRRSEVQGQCARHGAERRCHRTPVRQEEQMLYLDVRFERTLGQQYPLRPDFLPTAAE